MLSSSKGPTERLVDWLVMALAAATILVTLSAGPVRAAEADAALQLRIVYLSKRYAEPPPLSLVDPIVVDKGLQGARIAIRENNITGRLIGHSYELEEVVVPVSEDIAGAAKPLLEQGRALILADLEAEDLLRIADLPEAKEAIILNVRSSDDSLRQEKCRTNIFHIPPSWAMRADALAQYLLWKKWRRWLLISGKASGDREFVAAIKRAASRFSGKIVDERSYLFEAGSRRSETGHHQIQTQMPALTQGAPDYDVVFAADTAEAFGDYLLFRTYEPRPVVGTHGLTAVAWHRSYEQYGGMSLQSSFEKRTKRWMTERDYTAWLGVRIFGEAVTRANSADRAELRRYIISDEFEIAGFKGLGMTFRSWDRQLRQPVLLSGPRALVSVSPQEGFLHERFPTDTLGFDEPESKCRFHS